MLRKSHAILALKKQYKGDVQFEEVEGAFVMIQHSTSTHIATIEGPARKHVQRKLEQAASPDGRQYSAWERAHCIAVRDCPKICLSML